VSGQYHAGCPRQAFAPLARALDSNGCLFVNRGAQIAPEDRAIRSGMPRYAVVAEIRAISLTIDVANRDEFHSAVLNKGLQKAFL